MNKMTKHLLGLAFLTFTAGFAQAQLATFDDISLPADSFYNGKDQAGGFRSERAFFESKYDTAFGGYWAGGFALSNKKDSTTAGFTNLYGVRSGSGHNSANYAVGQQDAVIRMDSNALKQMVGIYVNNSTYAYYSMKNGDGFAKKFGGATGNDPDFFLLTIRNLSSIASVLVNFYLADFTSLDNSKDYIVKDWTYVDLRSLGRADSLKFTLTSSDNGAFGMNTPAFFCIDDFQTAELTGVRMKTTLNAEIWPNPAQTQLNVALPANAATLSLRDITGKEVLATNLTQAISTVELGDIPAGMYIVQIQTEEAVFSQKIIKN